MRKEEVEFIDERIKEIEGLKKTEPWSKEFDLWDRRLKEFLERNFGKEKKKEYESIYYGYIAVDNEQIRYKDYCEYLGMAKNFLIVLKESALKDINEKSMGKKINKKSNIKIWKIFIVVVGIFLIPVISFKWGATIALYYYASLMIVSIILLHKDSKLILILPFLSVLLIPTPSLFQPKPELFLYVNRCYSTNNISEDFSIIKMLTSKSESPVIVLAKALVRHKDNNGLFSCIFNAIGEPSYDYEIIVQNLGKGEAKDFSIEGKLNVNFKVEKRDPIVLGSTGETESPLGGPFNFEIKSLKYKEMAWIRLSSSRLGDISASCKSTGRVKCKVGIYDYKSFQPKEYPYYLKFKGKEGESLIIEDYELKIEDNRTNEPAIYNYHLDERRWEEEIPLLLEVNN